MGNYQSPGEIEGPFGGGRKNIYLCENCGHGFVSQDLDEGTTPFMTGCLNCCHMAHSMVYAAPQEMLKDMAPAVLWYRPEPEGLARLSLPVRAHVEQGGLIRHVMRDGDQGPKRPKAKGKKKLFRP